MTGLTFTLGVPRNGEIERVRGSTATSKASPGAAAGTHRYADHLAPLRLRHGESVFRTTGRNNENNNVHNRALTLSLLASSAMAAVSQSEAARLGSELTPVGAEGW